MSAWGNARKVLLFGLLGALGCLAGWLAGEGFLRIGLPAGKEAGGSLASKPVAPKLTDQGALPAPPPAAPVLAVGLKVAQPAAPAPPPVLPSAGSRTPAPAPPEFSERLKKAGGKSGDVQLTLIWSNVNDLDLHCIEPSGFEVFFARRRSPSGGELDIDMNASGPETNRPVENIYWPQGRAPVGKYKVYVNHYANHGGLDPTEYKVSILTGTTRKEFSGKIARFQPKRLIHEFELKADDLLAKEAPADLRVAVSPELVVNQGGANSVRVRIARGKVPGPVLCRFDGDLVGLKSSEFTIPADQTEATAEITAEGWAPLGTRKVTLRASVGATQADAGFQVTVKAPPPELRIAVAPKLVIHQGGSNRLPIRIARANLAGPVQVRVDGDLRGITPREFSLGAADTETTVEFKADDSAPAAERALKLSASAGVVQATADFRLAVQEVPPVLRVAVPDEIQINQGGGNDLPVRIARERFAGPVKVRLEGDVAGVAPLEFTIPPDRDDHEQPLLVGNAVAGTREIRLHATGGGAQAESALKLTVLAPSGAVGPAWSWQAVLTIGVWTALLAFGLSLALVMGQNWYLARPWLSIGELLVIALGSAVAGLVAGGIGQSLYGLLNQARFVPELGFVLGWLLLGSLLGRGVVFFIPNLPAGRATVAGCSGGLLGALGFIAVSTVGDMAGRLVGAATLGFAIGLMVALVETAFRKVWLEVREGQRPVRAVNLGLTPVFIGGDARKCNLFVPGAPGKALKFWEDKGQIYCLDIVSEKTYPVSPGYRRTLKQAEVLVCSNVKGARAIASPPLAKHPPLPEPKAAPAAATVSMRQAAPPQPKPPARTTPPPKPASAPLAAPSPRPSPAVPQTPKSKTPAAAATAPCPVCGDPATGVPGTRRCANCATRF